MGSAAAGTKAAMGRRPMAGNSGAIEVPTAFTSMSMAGIETEFMAFTSMPMAGIETEFMMKIRVWPRAGIKSKIETSETASNGSRALLALETQP